MQFKHNSDKMELDEDTIFSTVLVLMIAGYETTGRTLSFTGYTYSLNILMFRQNFRQTGEHFQIIT